MDYKDAGIADGLPEAIAAAGFASLEPHAARLVDQLRGKGRDVCAQVQLGSGRLPLLVIGVLDWLSGEGKGSRALIAVPSEQDVAAAESAFHSLSAGTGFSSMIVGRDASQTATWADVAIGSLETLTARHESQSLDLRDFRFLALDGLSELSAFSDGRRPELIRSFASDLLPAEERRTLVLAERLGERERELALEFAPDPVELILEADAEQAKSVSQATYYVSADDKMRLLLGILSTTELRPVCLFCNLQDSAEETAKRLQANGIDADCVPGKLPDQRKRELLGKARSGRSRVLVLTDEGAEGLEPSWASMLVNYDIPLEGELYVKRLSCLDRKAEGAFVRSFACDRYVYGLPAVERFLGVSLAATQADTASFAPADKSAGMTFDRQSRSRERAEGREARPEQGARGPRETGGGRDRDNRGGRRGERFDGRSHDAIRADIAAATGGSLDDAPKERAAKEKPARQQGQAAPARGEARKDGTPRPDGNRPAGQARGGSRRNDRRGPKHERNPAKESGRTHDRVAIEGRSKPLSDPYAVSMEERMKIYRERYGKRLADDRDRVNEDKERRGGRRGKPGRGGAGRSGGGRNESGAGEAREGGTRPVETARRKPDAGQERGARPVSKPVSTAPLAVKPSGNGKAKGGILGAIKGIFGKKGK